MSLSILNNIPSLVAQNQLAVTNENLQHTLFQLSSGSRINTGADDPAGLAIANGLQANVAALQQSAQNAHEGIGNLQVADGALSQVTTLLNRGATLATEAANGGLSPAQATALNGEYQSILAEINQIGTNTTYNGQAVFGGSGNLSVFLSDGSAAAQAAPTISVAMGNLTTTGIGLGANASAQLSMTGKPTAADTVTLGTTTYTFVAALTGAANEVLINSQAGQAGVTGTLQNLMAAINYTNGPNGGSGAAYDGIAAANTTATATSVQGSTLNVQAVLGGIAGNAGATNTSATFHNGGWVGQVNGTAGTLLGGVNGGDLSNTTDATATLTSLNAAIASVASTRGTIGAGINRLTAAVNVMTNQVQNLTSAISNIKDADIGQVVANMSKNQVLTQTGISALAQANSSEQAVLKLLQ